MTAWSERSARACAWFGLTPERADGARARLIADSVRVALQVRTMLGPGRIALIVGPSGSGKSTILGAMEEACGARCVRVGRAPRSSRALIDLIRRPVPAALSHLARAGLADATVLAVPVRELSDGQRWRAALGAAMDRAERRGAEVLIGDEFCSTLDAMTAAGVARTVRRWVRGQGRVRAVLATARPELAGPLAPDVMVYKPLGAPARIHVRGKRTVGAPRRACTPVERRFIAGHEDPPGVRIEPGCYDDYRALSHHHYRAGPPATCAAVVRAVSDEGELAGVLVVSMPTLIGAWRELAWPGRYTSGDRRGDAARINAEVRTISRVIVDPRFRGQGVARGLVSAYLAHPLTPCTEAIAAMGAVCPFFARAGMTAYDLPPPPRDARLADALAACGLEPWQLLDGAARRAPPLVARELRRWAWASGATRRLLALPEGELAVVAGLSISTTPVVYAHTTVWSEPRGGPMNEKDGTRPPKPAPPPDPESLPQALTFFLTVRQRRAVLAALRRHDPDRARALCRALRITT